jgi:hypothetical protein
MVPDQIIGVPTVEIKCSTANGVTEVYSARSLEQIQTTAVDTQTGYKQTVKFSAGLEVGTDETGKATAGAETTKTTSLQFGTSNVER